MPETDLDSLQQWRLNWLPIEITWRSDWEARTEWRREERQLQRRERARRDRKFFGDDLWGVSQKHREAETDAARLQVLNLPALTDEKVLAAWLDISLARLRWFTFDRPANPVWHYVRHTARKRSGGTRVILAPKKELKAMQRQILREILERVPLTEAAHGFVRERSILTNAQPHVGKQVILNLDLKDFFPSITFPRVRGLFVALGYSFAVASVLALLCTERDRDTLQRGDKTFYVSLGPRHLVQGAPTSPALANLLARNLDRRLAGLARAKGFQYTRYADDLTFSGGDFDVALRIKDAAQHIILAEGFAVNPDKTRLYRQSARQVVTGLVVNEKVAVPRDMRRRVRAILHRARETGLNAQNRDGHENFRAYLQGLIGHIHQAQPAQAARLLALLRAVRD